MRPKILAQATGSFIMGRMRKKSGKVLQFNLDMMSISFWCKKWVRRNAAGIFHAAQQYVQKEMAILYAQIMIKM